MHAEKEAQKTAENPEKTENSSGNSEQSDPAIIGGRDSLDAPVRPKGLLEVNLIDPIISQTQISTESSRKSV